MAFGIEIINNNDRIIIDNNYANFGLLSTTVSTATANSSYPGLAGNVVSDLVVARAAVSANGLVSRGVPNRWAETNAGFPSSVSYYIIRRNDTLVSPQSSGYGLEVYANTGNVVFSANISKNFEIVAVGNFNGVAANAVNLAFPSTTGWYSDFDKYYCVVNPTYSQYFITGFPSVTSYIYAAGYRYIWANSTHGRIVVESNYQGLFPATGYQKNGRDFHYMIMKELS